MNDSEPRTTEPRSTSEFEQMLPCYPGMGAMVGLMAPDLAGDLVSQCLPAVVMYSVGCGVMACFLQSGAKPSSWSRDAVFAILGVPWGVLVAAVA